MAAVAKDVAAKEIERWLDAKKVNERKREAYADSIETLTDAVSDGVLTVDGEHNLVQLLKFPTEGEVPVTSLKYKPRLKVATIHLHLQGVKTSDADGRILAYIAALTGTPKEIVRSLDTEDYSIGQAIAIFFL